LEGTNFDQFLLSIDDIPFLGFPVAETYISSLEETFGVKRLCICCGVFEIAACDGGTPETQFAYGVKAGDIFAVIID
jgi:hypothetical protein